MGIEQARIIDLNKISNPKGNLTPIEGGGDIPFEIQRVYYTYDIPGAKRGVVTATCTCSSSSSP